MPQKTQGAPSNAPTDWRPAEQKMVPNKPLREAFEQSGLTPQQLACFLGKERISGGHACGDGGEVRRTLGIRKDSGGKYRQFMSEEKALEYIEALNMDPVDFGL